MRRSALPAVAISCLAVALVSCSTSAPQGPTPTSGLALKTFQAASVVIGQPTFTSDTPGTTQSVFGEVYGNPAVIGGVLYAPDWDNNRVMGYSGGIPAANGASADFVLGQPNFTSFAASAAADGMGGPQTVSSAMGKMYVASYANNRVLGWNTPPTTTQAPADFVLGQSGFGSNSFACTATGMDSPESLIAVGNHLIVADSENNRVLIFNGPPSSNGAAADVVLGQDSFTTCASDDDDQDGAPDANPSARTLDYPVGVWSDGTMLIVADADNNRVLIWNSFPTSNFTPADVVVGQSSMSGEAPGVGPARFAFPEFLTSNGDQLFVAEADNDRVVIFNQIPGSNGASADVVLGQGDFTHTARNDDNQNDLVDPSPTARTLYDPAGLLVTDDALVVVDSGNNRMLVFKP